MPEKQLTSYMNAPTACDRQVNKPFFLICRFASHPNRNLLAKFDQCGKTDILGQIVNGVEAAIGEFPW